MNVMQNRQQCVRVKEEKSPYADINVGVPQGTLAGPLFWLAFINSYTPPSSSCNTMYADDITCSIPIACSVDDQIQDTIDWGLQWSRDFKMNLNLDKTKAMLLTLGANSNAPTVFSPVDIVDQWKFLGVIIDKYLSFSQHVEYVTEKAQKRIFSLLQLKRLSVSTEKLCLFYVAHIRSILTLLYSSILLYAV